MKHRQQDSRDQIQLIVYHLFGDLGQQYGKDSRHPISRKDYPKYYHVYIV
jgi:hypothetical protein